MQIPEDVVLEILSYLRPIIKRPKISSDFDGRTVEFVDVYKQAKKSIGKVRLLSLEMNSIASPLFYGDIFVSFSAPPTADSVATLFSAGGHLIHTLTVDGRSSRSMPWQGEINRDRLVEAIRKGLPRCRNLQRLEALGNHCLFASRQWMKNLGSQLPQLKSLVFASSRGTGLSHCLIGIGRNLESLVIQGRNEDGFQRKSQRTFHLPSEFPKLQFLQLDGDLKEDQVKKLFSRLLHKKANETGSNQPGGLGETELTSLRHLITTGRYGRFHTFSLGNDLNHLIKSILPQKIGAQLTTFHCVPNDLLLDYIPNRSDIPTMHNIIRVISTACPNLLELAIPCLNFCPESRCIPAKLKRLWVFVASTRTPTGLYLDLVRASGANIRDRTRLDWLVILSGSESLGPLKEGPDPMLGAKIEVAEHPYLRNGKKGLKVIFGSGGNGSVHDGAE